MADFSDKAQWELRITFLDKRILNIFFLKYSLKNATHCTIVIKIIEKVIDIF